MRKILTALFTIFYTLVSGQTDHMPVNGLNDPRDFYSAFINVKLWSAPGNVTDSAILLIRDNRIVAAGKSVVIPQGTVIYNLHGKSIYPAFIDLYSSLGQPEIKPAGRGRDRGPQYETQSKGPFSWNQALKPEYDAAVNFSPDPNKASELRKAGFGMVLTAGNDGIARGTAAIVTTGDDKANQLLFKDKAAAVFSFDKGSSTQAYPSSEMGSIALLRQTWYDASWYQKSNDKLKDLSLESWNNASVLPKLFIARNYRSALRAVKIADEFNQTYIIKGAGDEYRMINQIKSSKHKLVIPLDFPKPFETGNPYDALNITLAEMKQWEQAPANAMRLEKSGIQFAITSDGTKDSKEFLKNLRKAVQFGLSEKQALASLTTVPAAMIGIDKTAGKLEPGYLANFFIASGNIFKKDAVLLESWISGKRYIIENADTSEIRGRYRMTIDTLRNYVLHVHGKFPGTDWSVMRDTIKLKTEHEANGYQHSIRFMTSKTMQYRLNGIFSVTDGKKIISGEALTPEGNWVNWSAEWFAAADPVKDSTVADSILSAGNLWYPDLAFGFDSIPSAHPVLFRNVTVWTNEEQGILTSTDVLIRNGKIDKIGKDISSEGIAGIEIVEGEGMHLTAGLIDEHSHIAIENGVNEGGQTNTAEVRIADVINPDDINIYRQLSGGVTTSHLLHGSANAIGGQSALIKLRWGKPAEELKFKGADPFIKFALGENVKQSNWGDNYDIRYPQTRMGVEQVYTDAFIRARSYEKASQVKGAIVRRDLELDAMRDILNEKLFITCHSYQQGEINMLMHVADSFGFRVNTFTHILEGYKVADRMKGHGAGGSTFADWWGYKYEVIEAIPQNAALMHKNGIVTAINSDDAEMARRLNHEAAKAVKYGGVSEEDALKFITLNPAKLLHIDKHTGSIKPGKDADVVLWNGPPLSVYSAVIKTFVDGICYYDSDRNEMLKKKNAMERQRITAKMAGEKQAGGEGRAPSQKLIEEYHCNEYETHPH